MLLRLLLLLLLLLRWCGLLLHRWKRLLHSHPR